MNVQVADKGTSNACPDKQDWVELQNTGSSAVSLSGFKLHDSNGPEDSRTYVFGDRSALEAGAFLVLCNAVDGDDKSPQFKIGGDDTITLLDAAGKVVSTSGQLQDTGDFNVTWAYNSESSSYAYTSTPTPGSANVFTAPNLRKYCSPSDSCWPSQEAWDQLAKELGTGVLHKISDVATVYSECSAAITAYAGATLLQTAKGSCIFGGTCVYQDCDPATATSGKANLPVYSVEATDVAHVQAAINFARTHSIKVSVKSTGASYSVANQQPDSLLIWMSNFKKYSTDGVLESKVICGVDEGPVLRVGGGETWGNVFSALAAGGKYMMSSGAAVTVGASGGWLQGGGLGPVDRSLGLGVDNVVEFEVVTADGNALIANACTNADLFWALRGGGGGNFGVVTGQTSKVHPQKTMVRANIAWLGTAAVGQSAFKNLPEGVPFTTPFPNSIGATQAEAIRVTKDSSILGNTASDTIDLWHDVMVGILNPATMDERLDGYYGLQCTWAGGFMCADLYFRGTMSEFETAFLQPLRKALRLTADPSASSTFRAATSTAYVLQAKEYSSYYDYASSDCTSASPGSPQDYICNSIGYPSANGYDSDVSVTAGDYETRVSWMLPAELFNDRPEVAKKLFKNSLMAYVTGHILGGAVNKVGEADTSVHPGMRSIAMELLLPPSLDPSDKSMPNMRALLQQVVPPPTAGPVFNHDARNLEVLTPLGSSHGLNWQQLYWQDNLPRLQKIKSKYDPTGVFTCRDCLTEGYHSVETSKAAADKRPKTTKDPPAVACPKCGTIKNSGQRSCCVRGGTWFKKCGNPGEAKFDHTWFDGIQACKCQLPCLPYNI